MKTVDIDNSKTTMLASTVLPLSFATIALLWGMSLERRDDLAITIIEFAGFALLLTLTIGVFVWALFFLTKRMRLSANIQQQTMIRDRDLPVSAIKAMEIKDFDDSAERAVFGLLGFAGKLKVTLADGTSMSVNLPTSLKEDVQTYISQNAPSFCADSESGSPLGVRLFAILFGVVLLSVGIAAAFLQIRGDFEHMVDLALNRRSRNVVVAFPVVAIVAGLGCIGLALTRRGLSVLDSDIPKGGR